MKLCRYNNTNHFFCLTLIKIPEALLNSIAKGSARLLVSLAGAPAGTPPHDSPTKPGDSTIGIPRLEEGNGSMMNNNIFFLPRTFRLLNYDLN